MANEDEPSGYRIYAEDGLPESVISYLETHEFPLGKSTLIKAVMFAALLMCIVAPFGLYLPLITFHMDMLAEMLWDSEPALLVSGMTFGSAIIMMFAGICLSGWAALIVATPIKGSTEYFGVWTLDEGISGKYASLNRMASRAGLSRTPKKFAHDPPRYLRAFAWRMAGLWGRPGLWLTVLAFVFLLFDLNYFTVVTKTTIHHSPYFSFMPDRYELEDVRHIDVGCSYDADDDDLYPYYSLALPNEVRFNLADMKPAKGTLIAALERFDQQFANRNVEIRRAKYEDGKHSGRPIADPACRIKLIELHGREVAQRWVTLLRLDQKLP